MKEYALLIVGVFLILASVTLLFLKRQQIGAALLLFFGVVVCLLGFDKGAEFVLNLPFIAASVGSRQQQLDFSQEIGALKLDVQKLRDAKDKQEAFNQTITPLLNKLDTSAGSSRSEIADPKISTPNPIFAENNTYSVFIFYRDYRATDSQTLVKGFTSQGFQTSAISTRFAEAPPIAKEGSTFIAPTGRGDSIKYRIRDIAKQLNMPDIQVGEASPLRRGDIQVFLY